MNKPEDKFHKHLDQCEQCRNHPFALCPEGANLLREAAEGVGKEMEKRQMVGFTRNEAPGALRNGTLVEKVNSEPGDTHQDGARATIVGSLGRAAPSKYGYFVEWDDIPGVPVFTASERIRLVRRVN